MMIDAPALTRKLHSCNTINPPTIILGPGEPEMAHKTDEFCYLSKIELAAEAYTQIARRWRGI